MKLPEEVARASGIETPTRKDLTTLDRERPKKGSNKTMTGVKERKLRSYVSEPDRGRRKWKNSRDAQKPAYDNRRRLRGNRLLRQRGEKVERGFAHMLGSGGLRRVHIRG